MKLKIITNNQILLAKNNESESKNNEIETLVV